MEQLLPCRSALSSYKLRPSNDSRNAQEARDPDFLHFARLQAPKGDDTLLQLTDESAQRLMEPVLAADVLPDQRTAFQKWS